MSTTTNTDIKSREFFYITAQVRNNSHDNGMQHWDDLSIESILTGRPGVEDVVAMNLTPDIWVQADDLSKAFLSTMWTELGQVSAAPNIFSSPELLQHFTDHDFLSELDQGLPDGRYKSSPENDTLLGARPSVITTNYLCQVPRRKPWGTLIIAILVADLVLLRALWTVVTFVASYFAKRRYPLANTCETCVRSLRGVAESSEEQSSSPPGGSALELEHLNGGSSLPALSRSLSLNESLGSR